MQASRARCAVGFDAQSQCHNGCEFEYDTVWTATDCLGDLHEDTELAQLPSQARQIVLLLFDPDSIP